MSTIIVGGKTYRTATMESSIKQLEQVVGPVVIYESGDDWALVASDEEQTGRSDEYVVASKPKNYVVDYLAQHASQNLLMEIFPDVVEIMKDFYEENLVTTWFELLANRKYEIEQLVDYNVEITDNERPLENLLKYAENHSDYNSRGLRKPSQQRVRRWIGDKERPLVGPTTAEWRSMSGKEKLEEVIYGTVGRPTPGQEVWAVKEWPRVVQNSILAGEPDFAEESRDAAIEFSEWQTRNMTSSDFVEAMGDISDHIESRELRPGIEDYVKNLGDEKALALVGVTSFKKLPDGSYYWEEG